MLSSFRIEARKYAVAPANEAFDAIRAHDSLIEAIGDCVAAVGFTRRPGKDRRPEPSFATLAPLARPQGPVALVFGNETTGLSDEDLLRCTHVAAIPASERL